MTKRVLVLILLTGIAASWLSTAHGPCRDCGGLAAEVGTGCHAGSVKLGLGCTAPPPDPHNCWKFVRCCGDGTWLYMRCEYHYCARSTWLAWQCILLGMCPWCIEWRTGVEFGCFPPDGYPEIATTHVPGVAVWQVPE
jgi:hypothetical protein